MAPVRGGAAQAWGIDSLNGQNFSYLHKPLSPRRTFALFHFLGGAAQMQRQHTFNQLAPVIVGGLVNVGAVAAEIGFNAPPVRAGLQGNFAGTLARRIRDYPVGMLHCDSTLIK